MTRIQRYLLKVKEADREKRKETELSTNPFGKKEDHNVKVENGLKYADDGALTIKLRMREIRESECGCKEDFEGTRKIFNVRLVQDGPQNKTLKEGSPGWKCSCGSICTNGNTPKKHWILTSRWKRI